MADKKVTIKEKYLKVKAILEEGGYAEDAAFIQERVDILDKKSANKKQTEKQKANEAIRDRLYEFLVNADKPVTISEIMENDDELNSTQKTSAILRPLILENKVVRTMVKKVAYFEAVKEGE